MSDDHGSSTSGDWVIIVRGVEARSPAQLELAQARIRTALRLPFTGTVTVRGWLFNDIVKGRNIG